MPTIDLGSVVGPQGQQGNTGPQGEQGIAGPSLISASTQTTLTGVLAGDGSTVGVRAVDSTPTNLSTNLVASGGVYTKITTDVANAYQRTCNPNLLDNWYFVGGGSQQGGGLFPINQRGQTTYAANNSAFYGIDRWQYQGKAGSLSIVSGGLKIDSTIASGANYISQGVGGASDLLGKTVTFSILDSDGNLVTGTKTIAAVATNYDTNVTISGTSGILIRMALNLNGVFSFIVRKDSTIFNITIAAIKLELGNTQTLAHQENNVWVLNEIPNWGEQLVRCISSFADNTDNYAHQKPAGRSILWQNPNSGNSFSAQTISNTGGFAEYVIIFRIATSADTRFSAALIANTGVLNGISAITNPSGAIPEVLTRTVTKNEAGNLVFSDGMRHATNSTTRTTDNTAFIPETIYGIS